MNTAKKAALVLAAAGVATGASTVSASAHEGKFCGAAAVGSAIGSPGLLSGNVVQFPVNVPINATGNSLNVIGLLNPAFGNSAVIC